MTGRKAQPSPRTDKAGPARRRQAEARGRRAEWTALILLLIKGYRLLARRYKSHSGEADLIVRKGGTLVFVEVKWRATHAAGAYAIQPAQQRRIEGAARTYLAEKARAAGAVIRFDVILLAPGRLPRHIKGAWRPAPDR